MMPGRWPVGFGTAPPRQQPPLPMKHTFLSAIAVAIAVSSAAAQWTQMAPLASPSARSGSAAATAPSGDVVVFGGNLMFGPTNELWRYDGATWTLTTSTGTPSGRANMDLVYDPAAGVFRMYGGASQGFISSTVYDQTWELDPLTWTWSQNVIAGPTPGGVSLHATSFDFAHGVMVVHGGLPDGFFPIDSDATWEFDGTAWTQYAITPATNPGPLERAAMCFHAGIGKSVLFGGIDVQIGGTDKTWLYDAGTHTWTELVIPGAKPQARTGAKMAYDSLRGVCVLTGGADPNDMTGQAYFADAWEFDGQTWTQVATGVAGGRLDSTIAYSPTRNRMVQFGGVNYATFNFYGDTWEWETGTFGSGCAGSNGVPSLSVSGSPHIGQSWTVTCNGAVPGINAGVLVFGFTALPGIDLGPVLGMTGCSAFVSPDLLSSVFVGSAGSFSWTWPSVSGPVGGNFLLQALVLDPAANAPGLTLSNAASVTLGL